MKTHSSRQSQPKSMGSCDDLPRSSTKVDGLARLQEQQYVSSKGAAPTQKTGTQKKVSYQEVRDGNEKSAIKSKKSSGDVPQGISSSYPQDKRASGSVEEAERMVSSFASAAKASARKVRIRPYTSKTFVATDHPDSRPHRLTGIRWTCQEGEGQEGRS